MKKSSGGKYTFVDRHNTSVFNQEGRQKSRFEYFHYYVLLNAITKQYSQGNKKNGGLIFRKLRPIKLSEPPQITIRVEGSELIGSGII